jgi:hypothetical protein
MAIARRRHVMAERDREPISLLVEAEFIERVDFSPLEHSLDSREADVTVRERSVQLL